ncbi:MAG: hypothetical protein FJ387_16020 [Verrucomicrobia bacterium]|nr:hypothetical protein [Verrucomicrobiota bacterium]
MTRTICALGVALMAAGSLLMPALLRGEAPTAATTPAPTLIYYTGFERSEGYSAADDLLPLRGQMGWVGEGSGGNGLLDEFISGYGQQAFVGFAPPAPKDQVLSVWRPIGGTPPGPDLPIVRFSVLMQIVDSTNGEYDDFRWSVYNTAGARLFTLDFDNSRAEIFFALDDAAGYQPAGFTFRNDVVYWLDLVMNFARNNWLAIMNGQVVVDAQPITTTNARLDLGDVDAVWAIRRKGFPGDNYLLFDEYQITAEPGPFIPPILELVGFEPDGQFRLYLHGERGLRYSIDVSEDLVRWDSLGTNRVANGFLDFLDSTAPGTPRGFYRARQVGL